MHPIQHLFCHSLIQSFLYALTSAGSLHPIALMPAGFVPTCVFARVASRCQVREMGLVLVPPAAMMSS